MRELHAVPVGSSVRLDCTSKGRPKPTVVWYKDGKEFKERKGTTIKKTQFALSLKDVIPADSGKYQCNVSNPLGWINHTYMVDVRGKYQKQSIDPRLSLISFPPKLLSVPHWNIGNTPLIRICFHSSSHSHSSRLKANVRGDVRSGDQALPARSKFRILPT